LGWIKRTIQRICMKQIEYTFETPFTDFYEHGALWYYSCSCLILQSKSLQECSVKRMEKFHEGK
jgi:hypothetical protein